MLGNMDSYSVKGHSGASKVVTGDVIKSYHIILSSQRKTFDANILMKHYIKTLPTSSKFANTSCAVETEKNSKTTGATAHFPYFQPHYQLLNLQKVANICKQ
jgi:hypothetical protein